jgi:hypothetical protein
MWPVVLGIRGSCSAAVGHKEGLREGLQGPNKEEAGGLGVRAPVGIAAVIRAGKADRVTALHDSGSGNEASGRRARPGDWPMGSCSVRGRRSKGRIWSPTGGVRLPEERAAEMTEKRTGKTEKRRND